MPDAPRPLDYATDATADPSAARYLRWVVASFATSVAVMQGTAVVVFLLYHYGWIDNGSPPIDNSSVSAGEQIGRFIPLASYLLVLTGAIGILLERRWGARLIFWPLVLHVAIALYGVVMALIDPPFQNYSPLVSRIMVLPYRAFPALLPDAVLFLVTPPMARLMRLR